MVHTILVDPQDPNRIYVAISAAGTYRSDDGGKSWTAKNKNVRADFMPERRYVNVFVEGDDGRWQATVDSPIQDGQQVWIVGNIAGGLSRWLRPKPARTPSDTDRRARD